MNLQNCAGYRRQLLLDFLQVEAVHLRIEQVAEETGYAPPESFRGRRKTSPLIIVILPDFGQCVLQDMMEHLRRDAMGCDFDAGDGDISSDRGAESSQSSRGCVRRAVRWTAVFAFNDDLAAGAMTRLREMGKRVPEDISVLGFDGSAMANYLYPPLTTVQQPFEQIARKTLDCLTNMQGAHDVLTLTLTCKIAERASCRAIEAVQQ